MRMPRPAVSVVLASVLAASASAAPAPAASPAAANPVTAVLDKLEFRSIGPAIMGGRVDDFAVVESSPSTFYVATASGGVWKTVNHGTTFEPVFDKEETSSIGDVTVSTSHPSIVYVGTGEPNNRQSSSWGNGVYRSTDAGRTWTHLGLSGTHHIGRIAVHPTNPEVAYVAALGQLWGPSGERGVFRTTDGGKTWKNVKFVDEDTGFVDVAMDPLSPHVLYAASYQRRRTPFGFNGGGPGSGLWKTIDGGETWKRLTTGLPTEGDVGRIGIGLYRRNPRIVYALVEHQKQGGIYRSDDAGESWKKMSDTNPRPSYYSKVHVDPNNDQRVWVLGAPLSFSEDGGKTFRTDVGQKIHGDYHALWIDPADSDHMLAGTDGGIHITYDRARSWDYVNTIPLAQFYEVHYDMRQPYFVCGGLQDNGSWCGPSRTLATQGISNEDWYRVGGGDGFYVVVDPTDATTLYVESQDGNVSRVDLKTGERRVIRPEPDADDVEYRFNWNSPILLSPHDPRTVYYGGHQLFVSRDRGETWSTASGDLTGAASRDEMKIFGRTAREMLSRNDGVVHYGTITTVAESPLRAGILWAGTDDGRLHVTRDGGRSWTALSVPGVPAGTYVSRVEASRSGEGAAYVAFDGHRSADFRPYVFRTEDFGQTWRALAGGLPAGHTVNVVREHPRNADVVFVGTERGLWVSVDRGAGFHRVRGNLPTVPVDDIQVHPREDDLILGTHGRGVWILDDLGPLSAAAAALRTRPALHVFDVRPATQWRLANTKGNTGHKFFLAPNPADGAVVSFWLGAAPGEKEAVTARVTDPSGALVRELKAAKPAAGMNRVVWDLRHEPPVPPTGDEPSFFGPPRGPLVAPGRYTVTVKGPAGEQARTVEVREDPRIAISAADDAAWREATRTTARLWGRADAANKTIVAVRKSIRELKDGPAASLGEEIGKELAALSERIDGVYKRLVRDAPQGFAGAPLAADPDPLLARARAAYFAVGSITAPPTPQHRAAIARLERALAAVEADVKQIAETDVPALNRRLLDRGLGRIDTGARPAR